MANDVKGYQWWTRRNNVAIRESNDNIDPKKMVITWFSFADEVKYFS